MKPRLLVLLGVVLSVVLSACVGACQDQAAVALPQGVKAVWDLVKAQRDTTPTRERICINGLWRWQPAKEGAKDVPSGDWGYFKVPGPWPKAENGPQRLYPHPAWKGKDYSAVDAAWYQREIDIPANWAGRRITVSAEYVNSLAVVYVDGKKLGDMYFPWGEVDLTAACRPGAKHLLSIRVVALPLQSVVAVYSQTDERKLTKGSVARRGLCGDVFLSATPAQQRIDDVKVDTSVRKWEITFDTALQGLAAGASYTLRATVLDGGKEAASFTSQPFQAAAVKSGRFAFTEKWKPEKLWDLHTPGNKYDVTLALLADGKPLDVYRPVRFGFREFYIQGRDFYLNGSRVFCMVVPFESANGGPYEATYQAARNTLESLKKMGINTVFTHYYNCQPGAHSALDEVLRAADDVGMLISLSQPHFSNYDWNTADASEKNGYARHAEFYVRMAQNHPSVVFYSTSHNATQYADDMKPDQIGDATGNRDTGGAKKNAEEAMKAEVILKRLDPTRVVYHHSSGNMSQMYTCNFYLNFTPIQERSDWFEHWATKGVMPAMLVEYGPPLPPSFTMYRGWYKNTRKFLEAVVPWEVCTGEWASQFLGDKAFQLTDMEKEDMRFEARVSRAGKPAYPRHALPYEFNNQRFAPPNRVDVQALYIKDNWCAYRTWGLSGPSGWSYDRFFAVRPGFVIEEKRPKVDWENLQKPGYSVDMLTGRPEISDWVPNSAGKAFLRYSQPLLAYIAGKPSRFSGKGHNFLPGQTVEKQIMIINNSRQTAECDCSWSLALPGAGENRAATGGRAGGSMKLTVKTGDIQPIPITFALPANLPPGAYPLTMTVKPSTGEPQTDSFEVNVVAAAPALTLKAKLALFDPKGETRKLLDAAGIRYESVNAGADLAKYDVLLVGKAALTLDGPAPDIRRVREGLKVVMFEQTSEVLEKRLGFRVQEYGLRNVFARVPNHPLLAGLGNATLHDWQGAATLYPPDLKYELWRQHGPSVRWAGIQTTRAYRAGCWGNVASVLIEKPACGDFLPVVDGGYSLQYSPLMVYREGRGIVLFCQMDVSGRSEADPAAERLVCNLLQYAAQWQPAAVRQALYAGDPAGKAHLEKCGITLAAYQGGKLSPEQALVVGPGGGRQLAASAAAVAEWLGAGGQLLAIGLDQQDANALAPLKVTMKKAEHIATCFEPLDAASPLAGVGPADVHNRDPQQLPLVSAGANVVGDGVLAKADKLNVVFCQLVPWTFDYAKYFHTKRTFRRSAFLVTRLAANMGVQSSTPVLDRFSSPVDAKKAEKRWLDGLYLDQPEEWDDPYRFFRW